MKATRRLLVAVFALCVAVAVSVGATFAWFTTSDTANITGISGQVTSGDASLEIRLVNATGGTLTEHSEETYAQWGYDLDLTELLKDVALKFDALSWKSDALKKRDGVTAGTAYTLGVTESTSAKDANYIDFYLAVRSTGQLKVYLAEGSEVTENTENEDKGVVLAWGDLGDTYGTSLSNGDIIDAKAENAVRVGIISAKDSAGLASAETKGVWAPNEADLGGKVATDNTSGNGKGYWKGQLSKDYEVQLLEASKRESSDEKTAIDTAYTDPEYTGIDCKGKEDESSLIVDMSSVDAEQDGYYHSLVHVAIWIEGTDGDCMNNIFNDTFKISLVLASAKVGPAA